MIYWHEKLACETADIKLVKEFDAPTLVRLGNCWGVLSLTDRKALLMTAKEYSESRQFILDAIARKDKGVLETYRHFDFSTAYITPTSKCNLNCDYCSSRSGGSPRTMSLSSIKKSIDYIAKRTKCESILFGGTGGECTVEYDIVREALKYAKDTYPDIKIKLCTNGVSTEKLEGFADFVDELHISFDGFPEMHDAHRKFPDGSGTSKATLSTIKKFGVKTDIELRCVFGSDFSKRLLEMIRYLHELDVRSFGIAPVERMGKASKGFCCMDALEGEKLRLQADELKGELGYKNLFDRKRDIWGCSLTRLFHVRPDGIISFCGFYADNDAEDEFKIGAVGESVQIDKSREECLQPFKFEKCSTCNNRFFCWSGCPKISAMCGGNMYAPPKSYCDKFKAQFKAHAKYVFERKVQRLKPMLEVRDGKMFFVNVFSKIQLTPFDGNRMKGNPVIHVSVDDDLEATKEMIVNHKNSRKKLTLFLLDVDRGVDGSMISAFLGKLLEEKVFFRLLKPLPICVFGKHTSALKGPSFPSSCESCLNLFVLDGDKARLCNGKIVDFSEIIHRGQLIEKLGRGHCGGCRFLARRQCDGLPCVRG